MMRKPKVSYCTLLFLFSKFVLEAESGFIKSIGDLADLYN